MKITLEAETTQESESMKEPWIQTGVTHIGVTCRKGADPLTYYSGNLMEIMACMARSIEELRSRVQVNGVIEGVVEAHNRMARQLEAAQIAENAGLGNGRMRIARP